MNPPRTDLGVTRRFALELGHELRLPLASLRTGTDLLAEFSREADLPEDWSRVVRMVQRGSDRMNDVADNLVALVDLIDLLTNRRHAAFTPVRIGELVTQAEFRLSRRAPAPASRIVNHSGDETWVCEPVHMARAIYVVMGVALSRSNTGREVTLRTTDGENGRSVLIQDGGPLLDPGRWNSLVNISLPGGEGSEGQALGLTVARMSAEVHGGVLSFENTPDGVLWRITLPAPCS